MPPDATPHVRAQAAAGALGAQPPAAGVESNKADDEVNHTRDDEDVGIFPLHTTTISHRCLVG